MQYCIDPTSDEPIMLISTHIGYDEECGMGVDGDLFQRELMYLDSLGKKRIQVWINSVGGRVLAGYNIASAILKSKTPVDTYITGVAASIAGAFFLCGRERVMLDFGLWMCHPVSGDSDDEGAMMMQESIAKMIAAKSGIDMETVSEMMNATTWLNPDQCLEKGIATKIEATHESNKKRIRSMAETTDKWQEANKITNSILKINTMSNLNKVTNKLGLVEGSNEDAILGAIAAMENKHNDALAAIENKSKTEKDELAKQIEDSKNALQTLQDKYDALEDTAATEKATNMVKGFAEAGRIKNEEAEIAKWVNLAKTDFEGTENLIKELPLNGAATTVEQGQNSGQVGSYMATRMREIRNQNKAKTA